MLKKEKMKTIFFLYKFEYVTWPYEVKTYICQNYDAGSV